MNDPTPDNPAPSRLQELFLGALELPPEQREVWLREQCGEDDSLFQQVRALLEQDDRTFDPLEQGAQSLIREALDDKLLEMKDITPEGGSSSDFEETIQESSTPQGAPAPGDRLRYFGDYELLEEIGRGGMGIVYKAKQVSLDRIVALKVIVSGQFASPSDVQRFQAEAETAGNLDHPNIVPILEIGDHDGQQYFSMKYIEGRTLAARLSQLGTAIEKGDADVKKQQRELVEILKQAAEGVGYAHQHGVLHRDLKPVNILIDQNNQPHVADFGLAKRLSDDKSLTQTGAVLGTPAYMSPEQAEGSKGSSTMAADVYSLGAILYQILTGRKLFESENVLELLKQVREEEPPRPGELDPEVDSGLEAICLKCLSKNPEERYTSAVEFNADLQNWIDGRATVARPQSALYQLQVWLRQHVRGYSSHILLGLVTGYTFSALLAIIYPSSSQNASILLEAGLIQTSEMTSTIVSLPDWSNWIFVPLAIFFFGFTGYLIVLLSRPKDILSDLSAGITTGLVCGILAFSLCIGDTILPDRILSESSISNYEAAVGREFSGIYHDSISPSDPLAAHWDVVDERAIERYPALTKIPNDEWAPILTAQNKFEIQTKLRSGIFWGVLASIGLFVILFICQTVVAGTLYRRQQRFSKIIFPYLEVGLPLSFLVGATLALIHQELNEGLQSIGMFTALTLFAIVGLLREWRYSTRLFLAIGCLVTLSSSSTWPDYLYQVLVGLLIILAFTILMMNLKKREYSLSRRTKWVLSSMAIPAVIFLSLYIYSFRDKPLTPEQLISGLFDRKVNIHKRVELADQIRIQRTHLAWAIERAEKTFNSEDPYESVLGLTALGRLSADSYDLEQNGQLDKYLVLLGHPDESIHYDAALSASLFPKNASAVCRNLYNLILLRIEAVSDDYEKYIVDWERTSDLLSTLQILVQKKALKHEEPEIASMMFRTISQLRPYAFDRVRLARTFASMEFEAILPLLKHAKSTDPRERYAAIELIKAIYPSSYLRPDGYHPRKENRLMNLSAEKSAEFARQHLIPILIDALDDPHPRIRMYAASVFGNYRDWMDTEISGIEKLLDHEEKGVRLAALVALKNIGPKASHLTPQITAMRDEPSVRIRIIARDTLAAISAKNSP